MGRVEELQKELAELKEQRERDNSIKKLEQQIKAEKFAQTKTGKVVNTLGKFGEKITRPPKKDNSKKTKPKKIKTVAEVMAELPQ